MGEALRRSHKLAVLALQNWRLESQDQLETAIDTIGADLGERAASRQLAYVGEMYKPYGEGHDEDFRAACLWLKRILGRDLDIGEVERLAHAFDLALFGPAR